jgi:hypothetical protein
MESSEISSGMEDDMRKLITVTVIIVVATLTTAWALSNPAGTTKALGGASVPTHASLLW